MSKEKWRTWQAKEKPYHPVEYDEEVVRAWRAFHQREATAHQQAIVDQWLRYVTGIGEFQDLSYRPGGNDADRDTAFAEGKRFVGLQILKMLHPATLEAVVAAGATTKKRGATDK